MVLNVEKSRFAMQKKLLAFFGVVPLLLATAWVPTTCPACHGSGVISNHGMEKVTLIEPPSIRKIVSWNIVCGSWLLYQMELLLTVQNDGDMDAYGFVEMYMTDHVSEYKSDTQNAAVAVSAGSVAMQIVTVAFTIPREDSKSVLPGVVANVLDDYCTCNECKGEGKVMLNSWFFSKKRWELHSTKTLVWEHLWEPPPFEDLEDWMWVDIEDEYGNVTRKYVNMNDYYFANPP